MSRAPRDHEAELALLPPVVRIKAPKTVHARPACRLQTHSSFYHLLGTGVLPSCGVMLALGRPGRPLALSPSFPLGWFAWLWPFQVAEDV